eukprot:s413_g5.t1
MVVASAEGATAIEKRKHAPMVLFAYPKGVGPQPKVTRAPVSVQDLTLVPQWYGADHALALYTWPEAPRAPMEGGNTLSSFVRPLRSLVGLHPLMLGGSSISARPARCLYSFCQLTSLTVVNGRSHLIVAGSESGSLLVYDLRARARSPAELLGDMEGLPPNPDPDVDHFQGAVWLPSAFSTDVFVLPSGLKGLAHSEGMSSGAMGFSKGLGDRRHLGSG